MDRMLVVVFDNESKAYEGKNTLLQLDGEGSIGAAQAKVQVLEAKADVERAKAS